MPARAQDKQAGCKQNQVKNEKSEEEWRRGELQKSTNINGPPKSKILGITFLFDNKIFFAGEVFLNKVKFKFLKKTKSVSSGLTD